jgi:ATP-dependent helicase HrpA
LLSGIVTQIACQREDKLFEGTRGRHFRVFPASYCFKKPPKWIMAAELLETTQVYAHCVAKIDAEWVRDIAPQLLKHQYQEPHWSAKQGQVMAYEQTSLYGLVLTEKKHVSFAKIDSKLAYEIFIRSALVEEQLRSNAPFYQYNKQLKKQLFEIEDKSRRRDVIANDEAIYAFYAAIIPEEVVSFAGFEQWRKQAEKNNPRLLFAPESVFQAGNIDDYSEQQFPDHLLWEGVDYALKYRFEPGHIEDGISVRLPVAALNRVPRFRFEWLVPGVLAEKCEALIKTLPKQYRRPLVPIPQTVAQLMPLLTVGDYALETTLAKIIFKKFGVDIPFDAWAKDKLDAYYKVNYQLLDEQGKLIEQSRDLAELIKKHGHKVQQSLNKTIAKSVDKASYTEWAFGDIEQEKVFSQAGSILHSYPALLDEGDKVLLTLTDYAYVQSVVHRKGVIRLAMLKMAEQIKYLRKELLKGNELQLQLSAEYDKKGLLDDLLFASINHTFFAECLPFSGKQFKLLIEKHRAQLVPKAQELESLLRAIVKYDYTIRTQLKNLQGKNIESTIADIEMQRSHLVYSGFIYKTPIANFYDIPRYFASLTIRLERLQGQLQKDIGYTQELQMLWHKLIELSQEHDNIDLLPSAIEYRWMLEEYRVSLFSQQLKTRMPISKKRLEKQWDKVITERRATIL